MQDKNAQATSEAEKQTRIQARLKRARALRARVRARNRDLTQEEAEKLADDIVREAVDSLIEDGKVKYDTQHARTA